MILHRFYLYDKNMSKNEYCRLSKGNSDRKHLYAVTTNNRFAKEFISRRDMSKFIHLKSRVNKEEGLYYINNHISCNLSRCEFVHYPNKSKNDRYRVDVQILCTNTEIESVRTISDMYLLSFNNNLSGFVNPYIFKEDYLHNLIMLDYLTLMNISDINNIHNSYDGNSEIPDLPSILLDEFMIFIDLYKGLFK
jgi:hypothetical protein